MEYHAADELDIVMPLPQGAPGGFADDGESLGQQVVQGGAVVQPAPELAGFGAQGGIVQPADAVLQAVDLGDEVFGDFGGGALRRVADDFLEQGDHREKPSRRPPPAGNGRRAPEGGRGSMRYAVAGRV